MDKFSDIINEKRAETNSEGKRWEDYDYIQLPDGTVIDMNELLKEQAAASFMLVNAFPMLASAYAKFHKVYTFQVETQATDGINIFINPLFTSQLSREGKTMVMAHEVMHGVLNHVRRGKNHEPIRSNYAADYEVNGSLVQAGIVKASTIETIGGLLDSKYYNKSYEEIYAELGSVSSNSSQNQSSSRQQNNNQQRRSNQQSSGSQDGNNQQQNGNQQSSNQQSSNQQSSGEQGSGQKKGGGQSGDNRQDKEQQDRGGNIGHVKPSDMMPPSGTETSIPGSLIDEKTGEQIRKSEGYEKITPLTDSQREQIAIDVAKKCMGDQMGHLKSKILGIYMTKTNWKKALRDVVGHSLSEEEKRNAYTNKNVLITQNRFTRTDKDRYDNMDYMMIWIDTSGSISDEMLRRFLSEAYAVALAKKPIKLVVVQCDTSIQEIQEFRSVKELKNYASKAIVKGRGGTDLKPCFDLLNKNPKYSRKTAELVLIFTDGWLEQYKRDSRKIGTLCWVILDNMAFDLKYKDIKTKVIHLNSSDIK